ncbi:MAG: hypothetical protein HOB17_07840 [Candidatus Marinimicrobia bacterium]|nr:hypothetical protein [Candidatus Neomarinimicrobiota bacterium]
MTLLIKSHSAWDLRRRPAKTKLVMGKHAPDTILWTCSDPHFLETGCVRRTIYIVMLEIYSQGLLYELSCLRKTGHFPASGRQATLY